jgi:hypothetical protein
MMDGYSITEAASVLGVPTERVWELLARGVLVGAPEGETGMRVFLQPRPAPGPVTASFTDDPGAPKSNGPERELSPFRELLTEFRNLTERYGQALLALGESRGEVASLRSRVELLEARIDLRLPMGNPAAPWPTQPLPVAEPAGVQDDEEAHRRRRRGARRATESFAEALARAEDPSPADLPGGTDAGVAFASDAAAQDADRSLPRDVLPAEPVLVAEEDAGAVAEAEDAEPPVAAAPETPTPEPIVDETEPQVQEPELAFDEPEPVELEPAVVLDQVEEVAFEPAEAEFEDLQLADAGVWAVPADAADERAEPERGDEGPPAGAGFALEEPESSVGFESEPSPELGADAERDEEPDFVIEVEALPDLPEVEASSEPDFGLEPDEEQPAAVVEPEEAPIAAADALPALAAESEAADFDAERYTSVIDQPDWYEAEADDWSADTSSRATTEEIEEIDETKASTGYVEPPPQELEAPEPDRRESGADEMEVAGAGQVASTQPEAPAEGELPGSRELDEALEAYGDVGARSTAAPPDEEWPPATPGGPRLSSSPQASTERVTRLSYGSQMPGSSATRAYRRLRRIFPT